MIAALATCLFVVYLYKTLNARAPNEPNSSTGRTTRSAAAKDLSARLESLQSRLQNLIDEDSVGGTRS